jgi:hypothetical protein
VNLRRVVASSVSNEYFSPASDQSIASTAAILLFPILRMLQSLVLCLFVAGSLGVLRFLHAQVLMCADPYDDTRLVPTTPIARDAFPSAWMANEVFMPVDFAFPVGYNEVDEGKDR